MTNRLPRLNDLYNFIAKVQNYPVSAKQLTAMAIREHTTPEIVEFYRAFPEDEVFASQDDLLARSENLVLISEEEKEQPVETLVVPEED